MINKRGMGFGAIVTMILGIVVIIGVSVAVVKNIKTVGEQLIGIEPEKKDEKDLEEGFKPELCDSIQKIVPEITEKTEYYKFSENEEQFYERITNALINCYDYYWKVSDNWKTPQGKKLCAIFDLKEYFKGKNEVFSQSKLVIHMEKFLENNKKRYARQDSINNIIKYAGFVFTHDDPGIQRDEDHIMCIYLETERAPKAIWMVRCPTTKHLKSICPLTDHIMTNPEMGWRMEKAPCKPIEDYISFLPAKKKQVEIYSLEVTKTVNFKNHEKLLNAVVNCYDRYKENEKDPTSSATTFLTEQICAIFDMRIDPYVNLREEDFKTIVNDIKNKYDETTKAIIEEAIKKLSFENKEGLVRDAKEPFFCVKILQGNTKIGKCERQGTLRIVLKDLEPTVPIDEQVCKTKENFQMKLTTTT